MMRWLLRGALLLMAVLAVVLGALAWFALQDQPLVARTPYFTPANIDRAKRLLDRNDPRKMPEGSLRTILIDQEDLDLAVNYAASRIARGSTSIVLQDGSAQVRATFILPANPAGHYLNMDATLMQTSGLPRVERLQIGRVEVPRFLSDWLLRQAMRYLRANGDYSAAAGAIKQISASEGVLRVSFVWSDQFAKQLKHALVSPGDQTRWKAYQERLVEVTNAVPPHGRISLAQLLQPMLQLAQERAAAGSAAAENRALIVVLAFYVNGEGLSALVPAADDWPQPKLRVVTLAGRTDSPLHFMVSAAISATAGSPLSDAIGVYKELEDARGGSGFSFNDLAADRAGTRFGDLATGSEAATAKLYRQLARGFNEPDFFPDVRNLPEFMPEAEFKRRYGGLGQPAYLKMLADIEQRIGALPLYQQGGVRGVARVAK
ncbi:MAG: hypothetical protein ABI343_08955 [Burkholderiaceae bacterium]